MLATAPADSTRAHEQTVRLSPGDLPVEPCRATIDNDAQTVRARRQAANEAAAKGHQRL